MTVPAVAFEHVDVVFGADPKAALDLLDAGEGRTPIQDKTGNVVAVHGASIAVAEGDICVLMGLSGSGKSSLLRCVNGLNKVTRGRVLVENDGAEIDVASCDSGTLRRLRMNRISMVFQHFALMPWRTIRDNVGFGLEIRGVNRAERDRLVDERLAMVRLAQWADKLPHELSGGMQQRVGLARAFATDADILLMDEPFSALDPLIRTHLQDELLDLQQSLRRSIIFVSHDLDEALRLGSRIAIMEDGRIVQYGTPEEIVTRPANEYVRRFVANMNPLNVLRGAALMRPLAALPRLPGDESLVVLDDAGAVRCRLDSAARPTAALVGDGEARLVPFDPELDLAAVDDRALVYGTPDISMRAAIEVHHATGRPLPLVDGDGCLVGVVGAKQIFRGMLQQTEAAADREAAEPPLS